MNLSISGHHLEVTPALREYVTTKLRRIRHHFDQVIDVNVILSVEKLVQRAEMKLLVAGREIFAEATPYRPLCRRRHPHRQARPAGHQAQAEAAELLQWQCPEAHA